MRPISGVETVRPGFLSLGDPGESQSRTRLAKDLRGRSREIRADKDDLREGRALLTRRADVFHKCSDREDGPGALAAYRDESWLRDNQFERYFLKISVLSKEVCGGSQDEDSARGWFIQGSADRPLADDIHGPRPCAGQSDGRVERRL